MCARGLRASRGNALARPKLVQRRRAEKDAAASANPRTRRNSLPSTTSQTRRLFEACKHEIHKLGAADTVVGAERQASYPQLHVTCG